jgi:hypothetical protein
MPEDYDFDAIVHHSRLYETDLSLPRSKLQRLASTMQKQFPASRRLMLSANGYRETPALPDGFLGGSAISQVVFHSLRFRTFFCPQLTLRPFGNSSFTRGGRRWPGPDA